MIKKIQSECEKINNLSEKEAVTFLISNNVGMDKDVFEIVRQMTFSQVHFDEHIQRYCSRDEFRCMMSDLRESKFERLNDILRTALEDIEEIDPTEYLIQKNKENQGNKEEQPYQIRKRLKKQANQTIQSIEPIKLSWRDKRKYEGQKNASTAELVGAKAKLDEVKQKLNGRSLLSRIRDMLFNRKQKNCFKTEKETLEGRVESLTRELQGIEEELGKIDEVYKSPEQFKTELLDALDIASNISADRRISREIKQIMGDLQEGDFEEKLTLCYPKIMDSFNNIDGITEHTYDMKRSFSDIASQLKMTAGIFDEKNFGSKDLLSLVNNIRIQMGNNSIASDHYITTTYRSRSLGKSIYITGTNFSQEQIAEAMVKLNEDFESLKTNPNTEDYVRGCADIFQKFLMVHPFDDGNGRTSRTMLTVMLAQRDIFIPNLYDSHFERDPNSKFMRFGDEVAKNGNYKLFQDYLLARVQKYNPGMVQGDFSYLDSTYKELLKQQGLRNIREEFGF